MGQGKRTTRSDAPFTLALDEPLKVSTSWQIQKIDDALASFCLETSGPGSHARHPAAWEPPLLGFPDKN